MEYLVVHRGGHGQSFVYELVFVPTENSSKPQLPGLIHVYDLKKSGVNGEKSAPSPRQVRGVSGVVHLMKPAPARGRTAFSAPTATNAYIGEPAMPRVRRNRKPAPT